MGFFGHPYTFSYGYSLLLQFGAFLLEDDGVKYHSVAYKVVSAFPENARRYGMKHESFSAVLDRVPGIGTALEAGYYIVLSGKNIHYLAFAFVSPLESEDYVYFAVLLLMVILVWNWNNRSEREIVPFGSAVV